MLYLDKKYTDEEKNKQYNDKIQKLNNEYNISTEDIVIRSLELNKVIKMFEEGIYSELENSQNIYQCIVATTRLIPGPSYFFHKQRYTDLNLTIDYLPYKRYINDILNRKPFKEIIRVFNSEYNINGNVENINLFIDALYNLNNYIKFKFSKIINYIEVANKTINNEIMRNFITLISSFNKLETSYKILDDLGIENEDAQKIIEALNINNNISASKMMRLLKNNKEKLLEEMLSPFSKNNIDNI